MTGFWIKPFLIWALIGFALGCAPRNKPETHATTAQLAESAKTPATTEKGLAVAMNAKEVPVSDIKMSICECKDSSCKVCEETMNANFKVRSSKVAGWAQGLMNEDRSVPNLYFYCHSLFYFSLACFFAVFSYTLISSYIHNQGWH